jgi:uncharacterized membrane protein
VQPRAKPQNIACASSAVATERVAFEAPWTWLAAGWRDMWRAPQISLLYGSVFTALSVLLTLGLFATGLESLTLALAGGFLLIGPVAAVGLYETSRRLELGLSLRFGEVLTQGLRARGQLGFFGAILAFAYFVWLQLAFLLFMLFFSTNPLPPAKDFVASILFSAHGLGLLAVGTMVGGMLALLVYAISVISVPLLMTRRIDAVSAMVASVAAVRQNPKPMLLWAVLIALFVTAGLVSLFVGLMFAFPLIGHGTWHAFRDLVREERDSYL